MEILFILFNGQFEFLVLGDNLNNQYLKIHCKTTTSVKGIARTIKFFIKV